MSLSGSFFPFYSSFLSFLRFFSFFLSSFSSCSWSCSSLSYLSFTPLFPVRLHFLLPPSSSPLCVLLLSSCPSPISTTYSSLLSLLLHILSFHFGPIYLPAPFSFLQTFLSSSLLARLTYFPPSLTPPSFAFCKPFILFFLTGRHSSFPPSYPPPLSCANLPFSSFTNSLPPLSLPSPFPLPLSPLSLPASARAITESGVNQRGSVDYGGHQAAVIERKRPPPFCLSFTQAYTHAPLFELRYIAQAPAALPRHPAALIHTRLSLPCCVAKFV